MQFYQVQAVLGTTIVFMSALPSSTGREHFRPSNRSRVCQGKQLVLGRNRTSLTYERVYEATGRRRLHTYLAFAAWGDQVGLAAAGRSAHCTATKLLHVDVPAVHEPGTLNNCPSSVRTGSRWDYQLKISD
ncbi:hypothetical protein O181_005460 [Austropuccinia psidii MF-1]|uniref:Uncharacterized protein n=1 Tax=Austropuccinia psidii MF-1 TaxID=1389203 RepID=A0A9Q3GFV4_9BASI|nr:hypothetical protein [Austropuccinia psidii MF-1]